MATTMVHGKCPACGRDPLWVEDGMLHCIDPVCPDPHAASKALDLDYRHVVEWRDRQSPTIERSPEIVEANKVPCARCGHLERMHYDISHVANTHCAICCTHSVNGPCNAATGVGCPKYKAPRRTDDDDRSSSYEGGDAPPVEWSIEHPLTCRLDGKRLLDCETHLSVEAVGEDFDERGRFYVELDDDSPWGFVTTAVEP